MSENPTSSGAKRLILSLSQVRKVPIVLQWFVGFLGWILLVGVVIVVLLPGEPQLNAGLHLWMGTFLLYQLALTYLARQWKQGYESPRFQMVRIQINLLFMASLTYVTGGEQSYFWVTFLLPLTAAVLYFERFAISLLVCAEAIAFLLLSYFFSSFTLVWSVFLVNSSVLLVLYLTLYFLMDNLRARQLFGSLGAVVHARSRVERIHDVEGLKSAILEQAVEAVAAKSGSLMLVNHEASSLVADHYVGRGRTKNAEAIRELDISGNSIAAWVAREGKAFRTGDVQKEPKFLPSIGDDIVSLVSVPIMVDNELMGVLNVDHDEPDRFDADDEQLLIAYAAEVAIVLRRTQLLNSLIKISDAVGSTLELGTVGEVILDQLGMLIQFQKATIQLIHGSRRELLTYRGFSQDGIDSWLLRPIAEDPLISRVLENGKPLILSDTSSSRDWEFREQTADVKSWVGVPLIHDGTVLGLLTLDHPKANHFTESSRELLTLFGSQAAIALRNWQILKTQRALYDTSLEISRELELDALLEGIVERAADLLNTTGAGFYECDYRQECVRVRVVHNITSEIVGITLRFGEGMAGRVAQDGQSRMACNYQEWDGAATVFTQGEWKRLFEGVLEVPVKWQDRVIGVLSVVDRQRAFSQDEVHLLQLLASQAAIAIHNAGQLKRFDEIVNTAFDAIIRVDEHGRITQSNQAAQALLGYSAEEFATLSASALYCKGIDEATQIQDILSERSAVRNRRSCVLHKDGHPIHIVLSASALSDSVGMPLGSVGFFEDLSEVRKLRVISDISRIVLEAIRRISEPVELQELLDIIVSEAGRLFGADAASILIQEEGRLVDRAFAGYTQDEVESVEITAGIGLVGKAFQDGRPYVVSDVTASPDYIAVSDDVRSELDVPIVGDVGPIGVLHVSSHRAGHFRPDDQTSIELAEILAAHAAVAIQRIEIAVQQQETQERLLRTASAVAAGRLAAGVAHELKNSLSSISLSVHNLGERLQRIQGLPGQKEMLDKIARTKEEVNYLAEISIRLHRLSLDWEPEKRPNYLNEVVRQSLKFMQGHIAQKRCSYRLDLDPALDRPSKGSGGNPISMDERQIQQVIVNMTLNAIDACARGQPINYQTKWLPAVRHAELRIQDYGVGMSDETRRSLFKPFFTTKPDGTGLGLYISHLIVRDKHGGDITFDTKLGRGTTFTITLPQGESV